MQISYSGNQHVPGTAKDERLKEPLLILGAFKKNQRQSGLFPLVYFHCNNPH